MKTNSRKLIVFFALAIVLAFIGGMLFQIKITSNSIPLEESELKGIMRLSKQKSTLIDDIPKDTKELINLYQSFLEPSDDATAPTLEKIEINGKKLESVRFFLSDQGYVCMGLENRALWMGVEPFDGHIKPLIKVSANIDLEFLPEYEKEEIEVVLAGRHATLCINKKYGFLAQYVDGEMTFSVDIPTASVDDLDFSMLKQGLLMSTDGDLYSLDFVTPAHSSNIEMQINHLDSYISFAGKLDNGVIISYNLSDEWTTYRFDPIHEDPSEKYISKEYEGEFVSAEFRSFKSSDNATFQNELTIYFSIGEEEEKEERASFILPTAMLKK